MQTYIIEITEQELSHLLTWGDYFLDESSALNFTFDRDLLVKLRSLRSS